MLVSKTPLRISFLGGGTDFPWFFETHGGAVISAAINQHIFISALPSFDKKTYYLKYSDPEIVQDPEDIQHPIFREVLKSYDVGPLDISVMAEIPAGNGLASSSAFTVGLLNLVTTLIGRKLSSQELAMRAISLELDNLLEPIGVQDQLGSTFGGLNVHTFGSGRKISSSSIANQPQHFPFDIVLVKVGHSHRSARTYTEAQRTFVFDNPKAVGELEKLRDLTIEAGDALMQDITLLPNYLREGWRLKVASNPNAIDSEVIEVQEVLKSAGSLGSKLLGAGGGGLVLALMPQGEAESALRAANAQGRRAISVDLDFEGAKTIEV
jgi:D-glycero-alpha-D-manno-heptose-7-phosphate kinase